MPEALLTTDFHYEPHSRPALGRGHQWEEGTDGRRCVRCGALSHWPLADDDCFGITRWKSNMRKAQAATVVSVRAARRRAREIREAWDSGATTATLCARYRVTRKQLRRLLGIRKAEER